MDEGSETMTLSLSDVRARYCRVPVPEGGRVKSRRYEEVYVSFT